MIGKNKVVASFADAVRDIPDGATIVFAGFADIGMPANLIRALAAQGAKDLTLVANRTGGANLPPDTPDIGLLVERGQVRKVICAFTAPTRRSQTLRFSRYYEAGLIDAELAAGSIEQSRSIRKHREILSYPCRSRQLQHQTCTVPIHPGLFRDHVGATIHRPVAAIVNRRSESHLGIQINRRNDDPVLSPRPRGSHQ
jgi:hypothetical protein